MRQFWTKHGHIFTKLIVLTFKISELGGVVVLDGVVVVVNIVVGIWNN